MNKKYIAIFVAVILVTAALLLGRDKNQSELTLGVIAPLSGIAAQLGEWQIQGINLAVEEINDSGGINGAKIKLLIHDDKCAGKDGVDAYNNLTQAQGVQYIIGPLCGNARVPVLEAANGQEVVIMTTGLGLPSMPDNYALTFNVLPSASDVAARVVEYAVKDLGYKKISYLYSDDEYGKENDKAIRQALGDLGGEVISAEMYLRTTSDLKTQVAKFASDSSQAVILVGYTPAYNKFLKEAKEIGLEKQILAVSNIQDPAISEVQKTTGQKIFYAYPVALQFDYVKNFAEKYRERYPEAADLLPMYIGSGYDSTKILALALEKCGLVDAQCVDKEIQKTAGYQGANGPIEFDENGNNKSKSSIEIRVLDNGEFKRL